MTGIKLCGLTGGVGMGKSTAAGFLSKRGICLIDTDQLARQLVQPGEEALAEIREAFGDSVIDANGNLRRDVLAQRVFSDAAARHQLEAILHPRIRQRWKRQVDIWCREQKPLAVVVIPLLFETAAESEFDSVVCVACSAATQRQRLLDRGWSESQIAQRIAAQWPIEMKMARADRVIWSEGSLDVTEEQVDRVAR